MPSLADSQHAFADALRDPSAQAPSDIARPANRRGTRRFDVYRNNVAVSLGEALEAAFPAVEKLIGKEFFRAAARAYIAAEPPRSPIMFRYGATFGDFLDAFAPTAGVPYLGDVARLEFARLEAYHAADAKPAPIACLGAVAAEAVGRARLVFHPSTRLVRSRFPVVSLWAAVTGKGDENAVDMGRGEGALVVRPALAVDTRILPAGGADFIARLIAGDTLGDAAGFAGDRHAGFELATHLAGLFETGTIVAVEPT